MVWLGAEPARLAELYWLSLLLKAVGSAGGSTPEPGRIRGPARVMAQSSRLQVLARDRGQPGSVARAPGTMARSATASGRPAPG